MGITRTWLELTSPFTKTRMIRSILVVERRTDFYDTDPKYQTYFFDGVIPDGVEVKHAHLDKVKKNLGDTIAGNRTDDFPDEITAKKELTASAEKIIETRKFFLERDVQKKIKEDLSKELE